MSDASRCFKAKHWSRNPGVFNDDCSGQEVEARTGPALLAPVSDKAACSPLLLIGGKTDARYLLGKLDTRGMSELFLFIVFPVFAKGVSFYLLLTHIMIHNGAVCIVA
jgi:hypothetical protein